MCQIISKRSVLSWFKIFKYLKTCLKDVPIPVSPTKAYVAAVENLIKQSARSTMKELVYSVSPGSVHEKLTEEFKQIKKLYSICSVPLDNHRISEMLTRDET